MGGHDELEHDLYTNSMIQKLSRACQLSGSGGCIGHLCWKVRLGCMFILFLTDAIYLEFIGIPFYPCQHKSGSQKSTSKMTLPGTRVSSIWKSQFPEIECPSLACLVLPELLRWLTLRFFCRMAGLHMCMCVCVCLREFRTCKVGMMP